MQLHRTQQTNPHSRQRGFSLVVTLMMLILLSVLAVGMLSISAVTLRSTAADAPRMRAMANARMALALAIGQLQDQLGSDQRISAPSKLAGANLPDAHLGWHGAWRSDEVAPMSFPEGRRDRFLAWLVSQPAGSAFESVETLGSSSVVMELLTDGEETRVPLLSAPEGKLAWWTVDEAQKAMVDLADLPAITDSGRIALRHASPRTAPETVEAIGAFPKDQETVDKIITPAQLKLAGVNGGADLTRSFTTGTRTVMSNVRDGGLKRDLSSLMEMPADDVEGFGKWTGSGAADDPAAYIYGNPKVAFGARWNTLHAYYNLFKQVETQNGEPRIPTSTKPLIDWRLADARTNYGDEQGGFRYPRISRILYVFSYSAVPPSGTETQYRLRLGVDIYVLLWNPFDVRITWPANHTFFAKFSSALPFKFAWHVNGTPQGQPTRLVEIAKGLNTFFVQSQFKMPGEATFNLSPGETRLFSLGTAKSNFLGTQYPDFVPGLFFNDVLSYPNVLGAGGEVRGGANDRISVGMVPFNETGGVYGKAQYVDFWIYDQARGWPFFEHRGEVIAEGNTQFTQQLTELSKDSLPSVTMADAAAKKKPFAAFVMEMKSAADSTQATPSFLFSGAGRLSSQLSNSGADFALDRLEYKLEKMESFQSDLLQTTLPGDPNGESHGFIGSGRFPFNGRTHVTTLSVPTMPPVSIGNLRHAGIGDSANSVRANLWLPQNVSTAPPPTFTDQAVGNSYAHPRVPAEKSVVTSGSVTLSDHSYLANEALWDGWFFSSLSSRKSDGTAVEPAVMWEDFVSGEGKLLNPRFGLWEGGSEDEEIRNLVFDGSAIRPEAHRQIASHLMLKGGFNVNSTSVDAWTAFLSSTRNRSIRKLNRTGAPGGDLLEAKGTLFSRTDFVLDDAVEDGGADSQYSGFRDLSDEQIRDLAEKIVAEVKKRGPFLNLSQFVNRRLVSDPEFSLSGAIQSAIDATGINDEAKALGKTGISTPTSGTFANTDAAQLNTSAGSPGWLMQGDILDPLGSFITVRGDTFRIRAYGEATGKNGEVLSRAWCEAVVQRTPEYLDTSDSADTFPPVNPINLRFGRKFRIVSFRWLNGPQI